VQIKIGHCIFDSKDEPMMIVMDETTRTNIADMAADATKYAEFPEGWGDEEKKTAFMVLPGDKTR